VFGGLRVRGASVVLLSFAAAVAAAGCNQTTNPGVAEARTAELARAFAPLVSLHPREQLLPMSAKSFIASSALRWRSSCGEETIAMPSSTGRAPSLESRRLGSSDPYSRASAHPPGCRKGRILATNELTRPFDPARGDALLDEEGFYLDLADNRRSGTPAATNANGPPTVQVPVYFERDVRANGKDTMVRLTYWMLFGMERRPGPKAAALTAHEGDWKWIRVLLRNPEGTDDYVPMGVRYGARTTYLPWRSVQKGAESRTTHPAVFVSRGSHDLFPEPGVYSREVVVGKRAVELRQEVRRCPACTAWRTWQDMRDARDELWHGYGGGWGESLGLGASPAGIGPSLWVNLGKDELLEPGDTG